MARHIPRPKWDVTEYRAHETVARIRCLSCSWRSDWIQNTGLQVAQAKADHRFTNHDPRSRLDDTKRQYRLTVG